MSNLPIYEMLAQAFASEGVDTVFDSGAIFGRTDFGSISQGFGLRGTNVTDLGQLASLLRGYEAQGFAEIWNIPISDQVTSPTMRRVKLKGHGVI